MEQSWRALTGNKHRDEGMESRMTAGLRSKDRSSRSVVAQREG